MYIPRAHAAILPFLRAFLLSLKASKCEDGVTLRFICFFDSLFYAYQIQIINAFKQHIFPIAIRAEARTSASPCAPEYRNPLLSSISSTFLPLHLNSSSFFSSNHMLNSFLNSLMNYIQNSINFFIPSYIKYRFSRASVVNTYFLLVMNLDWIIVVLSIIYYFMYSKVKI